jgi:hypothetical protein
MLEREPRLNELTVYQNVREQTYCIYLTMNLFMRPPVIAMEGRMALIARASRQFLIYAKTKPVTNAEKKPTTRGTFSDKPCWTKSRMYAVGTGMRQEWAESRTGIRLYASGNLTGTNLVEKGNILAEDGL